MRQNLMMCLGLSALCLLNSGCSSSTGDNAGGGGGGGGGGQAITTDAAAKSAWSFLWSAGAEVNGNVAVDFTGPVSVAGAAGSASVTGTKTESSTSYSTSYSTTRAADLNLSFASFVPVARPDGSLSGDMRWYDYYYSRTACSSSTCASSTHHTEAIEGTNLTVKFEAGGVTYSDVITISAGSPDYTSRWDVTITTKNGTVFSFSD